MTQAYSFPSLALCNLFSFSSLSAPPPCRLSASAALLPALAVVELPAVASAGSQLAVLPSLQLVNCSTAATSVVPLPLLTSLLSLLLLPLLPAQPMPLKVSRKRGQREAFYQAWYSPTRGEVQDRLASTARFYSPRGVLGAVTALLIGTFTMTGDCVLDSHNPMSLAIVNSSPSLGTRRYCPSGLG